MLEPTDALVSFAVPGSPHGQVGELVGVLLRPGQQGSSVLFWQVVGLLPGRAIVWRALSTDPAHTVRREVSVEPDGPDVRVTMRVQVLAHRDQSRTVRRRQRTTAERYLEVLRSELEA